jgi:hypothetical protein
MVSGQKVFTVSGHGMQVGLGALTQDQPSSNGEICTGRKVMLQGSNGRRLMSVRDQQCSQVEFDGVDRGHAGRRARKRMTLPDLRQQNQRSLPVLVGQRGQPVCSPVIDR